MTRLWLAAVGVWLAAGAAGAASPDPKDLAVPAADLSKAQHLVRKLGSEAFREREQAQDDLAKMGRLARPALAAALATDPNPEVRFRAATLLPRSEAADLQARIDTFLADTDRKFEHDLPGFALLRKETGGDKAADKAAGDLYVEAIKTPANLALLTALAESPEAGGKAIADRRMALYVQQNPGAFGRGFAPATPPRQQQPTVADMAVLLLAEATVPAKDVPRTGQFWLTAQLIQSPPVVAAINNPGGTPHADVYKRVFVKWLDTRTSPEDLNQVAWIANNFKQIKETGPLLKRIITTDGVQGHAKAQAMVFLLQRGKEDLPTVRTQLKNDTSMNNGRIQIAPNVFIETQIRDVALALCLHYDGQDPKKYGFEFQQGFNTAQVAQSYWGYGFKSDDDRAAAFKKFAEYEAQKKAEPKK